MRSPRSAPPVTGDDGSTAKTATRKFCFRYSLINAPVVVDLPTPGGPVIPIIWALPASGMPAKSCVNSGVESSMTLSALPSARTSPAIALSIKACMRHRPKELG